MSAIEARLLAAGMGAAAAESRALLFARVETALRDRGKEVVHRIHVPGRVEVLGKHTDYAGGRSLLTAVERGFCVASAPRKDAIVRLIDVGRADEATLAFEESAEAGATPHWAIYPAAVVRRLVRDFGPPLVGADIAFISDLPPASGLSSSSSLLIAAFEALRRANDLDARDAFKRSLHGVLDVAAYAGSVETGRPFRGFSSEAGVGVAGGSQDHTAILASQPGRLCRFGFAPVREEGSVALPADVTFVIGVSGVVAQKSGGAREAYNRAAALSAAILEAWHAETGRSDATLFDAVSSNDDAPMRIRAAIRSRAAAGISLFAPGALESRLDQFVEESLVLIPRAFDAMAVGDLATFGAAVDASQRAAERGLSNQVPETIELARLARSLGAHAASAFGAGFGGSVWALVSCDHAKQFQEGWSREYRKQFDHPATTFFPTNAGPPLLRL